MNSIRFPVTLSVLLATSLIGNAQSFTYTTENSKTTITGFSAEPSGAVTVPATLGGYTVTEIGRSAFKGRTGITSVGFAAGASVTKLGTAAFQGCTALQTISLPTGTTVLPAGLLQGCSSLTSVTIPSTVTSIGPMAFAGCSSLTTLTLPSSLTSIGESALSGCANLTSVSLPAGVTSAPAQLCDECRSLTSISFAGNVTAFGDNAFHNCAALGGLTVPNTVTTIGGGAFSGCTELASITLGSGLATLGSDAFQGCAALGAIQVAAGNTTFASTGGVLFNAARTTLILCPLALTGSYAVPNSVTTLAAGAFAHCAGLSSITLPAGLATIPDDAFYYAANLTTPPLDATVTTIGSWAYAGLRNPTSLSVPSTVATLGDDAFHSSSALEWVIFEGNSPATMGDEVFDAAADGFAVYYYSTSSGFTSPLWFGYTAVEIGSNPALVGWLIANGFTPGTAPLADPNQDGVSLLMAYALGLDPAANLSGSMPRPVLANGSLSLTFQGDSDGVFYGAETSTDLATWTANGVTLTAPDAAGKRTATIPVTTGNRFLRLAVQATP